MKKRITKEEINNLYKKWDTPSHVIAHCKAVADVAAKLASELNNHGYKLDIALVRGSALAHDVARIHENHAAVGSKIFMSLRVTAGNVCACAIPTMARKATTSKTLILFIISILI